MQCKRSPHACSNAAAGMKLLHPLCAARSSHARMCVRRLVKSCCVCLRSKVGGVPTTQTASSGSMPAGKAAGA